MCSNAIRSEILWAIVLPRSVERIYDLAFAGCPNLRYIIVPDECDFRFQQWAFKGCSDDLTFSVVTGSTVIPALKRFGYNVEERPENTMEAQARRIAEIVSNPASNGRKIEKRKAQSCYHGEKESLAYNNLLPQYQLPDNEKY